MLFILQIFTQLGSVNINKSATASPSTGGPFAYTNPTAPRLLSPYLCRMDLMTWCAPSPWYSQVCWLLRTESLVFTFWLPMYLWKSRIFSCLNSSRLSTPVGRQQKQVINTLLHAAGAASWARSTRRQEKGPAPEVSPGQLLRCCSS